MIGKRLILILAAGALLLLPFADCMSAMAQDQQTMKCCAAMHCMPSKQSQDCCKATVSAQTSDLLPGKYVSLHGPNGATITYPRLLEIVHSNQIPPVVVNAPQHSPPELYALHSSLLI